jgi:hypothetical protein
LRRFAELLRAPRVHPRRLALASKTESAAVRERLRVVLEYAGYAHEAERVPRARTEATRRRALKVFS